MKRLIFSVITSVITANSFAQSIKPDAALTLANVQETRNNASTNIGYGNDTTAVNASKTDTTAVHTKDGGVYFGITFSRFDLGLATLIDNGSFTLSPQNQFLRYRSWKTSNVGFDVIQFGVKVNKSFKIYLSGGFDWTLIRLRDNITILRNQPVLTYRQDNIDYSKNRFSSSYLRIPLSFEFKGKENANGSRFHLVVGPEGGFLLNGRVKQISAENGKQKFDDTYHFTTFRYGGFARMGYGALGLFAKYYVNDMFENSPAQKGLKNFSFGLMLGF